MFPTEENPTLGLLQNALRYRTQEELASELGVQARTVRRWLVGESAPKQGYVTAVHHLLGRDERPRYPDFTFIDLFAGIGGLRKAFESRNGRCVFTSEWDSNAIRTYKANFPDANDIAGDITKFDPRQLPSHDLLLAGFPCQPFSLAGVSKKNSLGRQHGFLDKTQGTLFFNVVKILEEKRPRAFLLENVKNLKSHDSGQTFQVIMGALRELGYHVVFDVIDSTPWVPQRRQRIFIAGFCTPVGFDFVNLQRPAVAPTLGSILHAPDEVPEIPYTERKRGRTLVSDRYTLSDKLWTYLQNYALKHQAKGNGFGCSVFSAGDVSRTLSARYHKDGSEILISQPGKNPRRLTPRECARLMGFDSKSGPMTAIPVSDTQAYRQFGNSVVVPVVDAIAAKLIPCMLRPQEYPIRNSEQPLQLELAASA